LDLLAQAVCVANRQDRWHAVREVERVRDVDEGLVREIVGLGHAQRFERLVAGSAVEHQLAVGSGVCELDRVLLRRPGADEHVVVELDELCRDRPPDIAGPENADLHRGECRFSAR
jgi:hypothetical protein